MKPEPGAARDDVVVVYEEQTVMRVLRVVVIREAEAVPGIEPVQLGVEAFPRAAHSDGRHSCRLTSPGNRGCP